MTAFAIDIDFDVTTQLSDIEFPFGWSLTITDEPNDLFSFDIEINFFVIINVFRVTLRNYSAVRHLNIGIGSVSGRNVEGEPIIGQSTGISGCFQVIDRPQLIRSPELRQVFVVQVSPMEE